MIRGRSPHAPTGPSLPALAGNHLEREWLTPGEVAAMLQLSDKTIYRLAKTDPTMPALKLGAGKKATVRFHRARLERWLLDRLQGAPRMQRRVLSAAKPAEDKGSNGA